MIHVSLFPWQIFGASRSKLGYLVVEVVLQVLTSHVKLVVLDGGWYLWTVTSHLLSGLQLGLASTVEFVLTVCRGALLGSQTVFRGWPHYVASQGR